MKPARGFRDVLSDESGRMARLESAARVLFNRYGYREVRIPTVELKDLFVKSTGETSDVVEKEMFEWEDSGGRRLALRPEATPGIVRLYLNGHLDQKGRAHRLFTIGAMFRAERPQAGRYREFEQIDAECVGIGGPEADAEMILLLAAVAEAAGVRGYAVRLNTLGDAACRPAYRDKLKAFLESRRGALCDNCRRRIDRNPLRALDCKKDGPSLKAEAPTLEPCADCADHFQTVRSYLEDAGFKDRVRLDPHLVRGLDYYSRTVWEFVSDALGAQDAFAAGGRYDALVKSMGGPDAPAVGWALGVERTLMAAAETPSADTPRIFVTVQKNDPKLRRAAAADLDSLRGIEGAAALAPSFDSSLKAQMKEANRLGVRFVVIEGEDELSAGEATIRDFNTKAESRVKRPELAASLRARLSQDGAA